MHLSNVCARATPPEARAVPFESKAVQRLRSEAEAGSGYSIYRLLIYRTVLLLLLHTSQSHDTWSLRERRAHINPGDPGRGVMA